jgi:hypothetical protein
MSVMFPLMHQGQLVGFTSHFCGMASLGTILNEINVLLNGFSLHVIELKNYDIGIIL